MHGEKKKKKMKDKVDNSRGNKKDELTQAYKLVLGLTTLFQLAGEKYNYRQYTSTVHISNWAIDIHH